MNPNSTVQMALAFGDVALKASAILLGGWLVSLALRRASAAARHLAWLGTLTAMLLLPLLILIAPAQPIAVLHEKPPVAAQIVHPVADTSMNAVALDLSSLDSSAAPSAAPVAPVLQHRSERTVWPMGGTRRRVRMVAWSLGRCVSLGVRRPVGASAQGRGDSAVRILADDGSRRPADRPAPGLGPVCERHGTTAGGDDLGDLATRNPPSAGVRVVDRRSPGRGDPPRACARPPPRLRQPIPSLPHRVRCIGSILRSGSPPALCALKPS